MFSYIKKYHNDRKGLIELFLSGLLLGLISFELFSLFQVIAFLLSFIVLLEVVRMITDYVLEDKRIMQLRLIIDGFIIFFLRDIVLVFSNEKYELIEKQEKIGTLLIIITIFFVFRVLSIKFSPNNKETS